MIEQALFAFLQADPNVTALVGPRIFPAEAAQGQPFPRLTYKRVHTDEEYDLQENTNQPLVTLELSCWVKSGQAYSDVHNLANTVRFSRGPAYGTPTAPRLCEFRGLMAGLCFVQASHLVDLDDEPLAPADAGEKGIQRVALTFEFALDMQSTLPSLSSDEIVYDDFGGAVGTLLPAHNIGPVNLIDTAWVATGIAGFSSLQIGADNVAVGSATGENGNFMNVQNANVTITAPFTWSSGDQYAYVFFRVQDANDRYLVVLDGTHATLFVVVGGNATQLEQYNAPLSNGVTYTGVLACSGSTVTFTVNGTQIFNYTTLADFLTATMFGVGGYRSGAAPQTAIGPVLVQT